MKTIKLMMLEKMKESYNPEKPYKIVVAKKLVSLIACSMIVVFMFMFFIFQIIKKTGCG